MKMTRRFFIALLIVSVVVSLLAFSATAKSKAADYDYLLEYYEEPILFDYDFSGEDVSYSLLMSEDNKSRITSAFVTDENAPGGKYLSVKIPASKGLWEDVIIQNNVYFNWNSDTPIDDFIIDMTVSGTRGDGEEKQLPKIVLSVASETCTDADLGSGLGDTIVALDFRVGCLAYLKRGFNADGEACGVLTNTDFALTEGTWYDVYVKYDSASGLATLTVTDHSDPTNTYTATDAYVPYSAIKNVRVGAHGVDGATSRDNVMNFAKLRGIGGKYDRNPADLQTVVEAGVLDMYADFVSESVSLQDKSDIADVAVKLFTYGFTTENEEVGAAYAELVAGIVPYCNDKLLGYATAYGELFDYYERRALIDEALVYVNYLTSLDSSKIPADMAEEVAANVQAINELDARLAQSKQASLDLIAAVGNNTSADYDDYSAVVDRYNALHQYGQYADPTYEGASEAYVFYSTLREAKEDIELKGNRFIEAANVLVSDADFNTRAEAFLVCKNNYFDNTSYPGVTGALQIYEFYYDTINTEIEMAENFIKYVSKADYADYVPMKLENLELAKQYMGCLTSDPYKGVVEAKEIYDRVKAEVEAKVASANLYIAAVNKLDSLSGDALIAGIENALLLQKEGNVLGVDGVTDANIKLDQIVSSMELSIKYRDYFLGLVASIDGISSPEQLYSVLREAKLAERNADASLQSVKDASAKLTKAIVDYNARVSAANAEFARANDAAANTCGIGKGTTPVADRVIALIKKFFDEE